MNKKKLRFLTEYFFLHPIITQPQGNIYFEYLCILNKKSGHDS